jgi:hypothetical protein
MHRDELLSCAMQVPFEHMTVGQVFFAVVHEQQRPPIPPGLPPEYVALMQQCWSSQPKDRPDITAVLKRLQKQYRDFRSTHVTKAHSSPASIAQIAPPSVADAL